MSTSKQQDTSKPAGTGADFARFEDQAGPALAALANRVVDKYTTTARAELDTLRDTLAGAFRQIEQALASAPALDGLGIDDCLAHLNGASEAYAQVKTDEAGAKVAAVRAELDHRTRQYEELGGQLEKHKKDIERLSGELEAHKRELAAAREESVRANAAREAEVTARQEAAAALAAHSDQLRVVEEQRQRVSALLEASGARLAALKERHAEHETVCRDLEAQLDTAIAREATARERAEIAERECERLQAQVENGGGAPGVDGHAVYEHAVAFLSLSFDRLLAMYQRFATGTSEEDLLGAIVAVVRTEFSRVVLFKVQANAFEGICQDGFKPAMDLSRLAIPRAMDSLLARAAASNEVEMLAGQELADAGTAPFGGTPTVAVAVPIGINGEPLAVVYADDVDQPHRELADPELRIKFAELVRQQVTPFLDRIAAERKRLADLDDYAAVLIKHLQTTHAADVRALMPERERQQRLNQNLDYARRLYAQRAQVYGSRAAALLDQRVAALADAEPATVLSRDLVAITEHAAPFAWSHAR